ncbi:MAG: 3-deoxy-manno-octulosonate cytidylyltransferase, partial [Porticoccaceae bacterium]|nr:3-deoxy-manno-octulosonate cytidylyltransferase [Porticoccaceae bacterium]
IPARYASSRLPAKPLRDIAGQMLVERVYHQACLSKAARVLVATDDERIVSAVKDFGGEVVLTSAEHASGTDRLAEVAAELGLGDDEIVVNVQGDEPLIPPAVIDQVAANLAANPSADVATLSEPITSVESLLDPNVVKVVTDTNQCALYFSRAPIPWPRDHFAQSQASLPESYAYRRHIGLYAYRAGLLHKFVSWPMADLEQTEALEQLRFLYQGVKIHVADARESVPPGVDTEADLQAVVNLLEQSDAQ